MSENIFYDCRWSHEVDEKFAGDFINTVSKVFKTNYTKELFERKYINNIYGESVLVVVYINDMPEGARGLWRNDIQNKEAYQPGDTCVTEACRGKGIFSEMTKRSVAMLPENAVIYNFPNENSFPGYIKMGWNLVNDYGFVLFHKKSFAKEHPDKMSQEYSDWWLQDSQGIMHVRRGKEFYLLKRLNKPFCYEVLASTDKQVAERFPAASMGIYFYRSPKKTFYNKRLGMPLHVVCKNKEIQNIPLWKIDAL